MFRFLVAYGEWLEMILFIERYRIKISVYSDEPASSLIVYKKVFLYEPQNERPQMQSPGFAGNRQSANLDGRIV